MRKKMYNANFADTFYIIFPRTSNGIKRQMKIRTPLYDVALL